MTTRMRKFIPTLTLLLFIAARAEEEGSGEINLEMTRDGSYMVSCNVDTDWSVNVCNGYVREYCEAFCEKKQPIYEERDKANAKDAKKAAKTALKNEKNAKLAVEIRAEKDGKMAVLPTTTTPDPALDPEYDPEATTTIIPEEDNSEQELGQLGGPAVEPPDTNAKTFKEMQIDHLRDKTFAKVPGQEVEEEDLSEFEMHDVQFKITFDSSVTEEQAKPFCEKVAVAAGLTLSKCTEGKGNKLIIELAAEGKAAAAAACENMESFLTSATAEAEIPAPTEMKCQYASEGELALDTNDIDIAPDTNDTNENSADEASEETTDAPLEENAQATDETTADGDDSTSDVTNGADATPNTEADATPNTEADATEAGTTDTEAGTTDTEAVTTDTEAGTTDTEAVTTDTEADALTTDQASEETTDAPLEENAQASSDETTGATLEENDAEAFGEVMWDESIQESLNSIQEDYMDFQAMASV